MSIRRMFFESGKCGRDCFTDFVLLDVLQSRFQLGMGVSQTLGYSRMNFHLDQ